MPFQRKPALIKNSLVEKGVETQCLKIYPKSLTLSTCNLAGNWHVQLGWHFVYVNEWLITVAPPWSGIPENPRFIMKVLPGKLARYFVASF